jgi:hypothetical protein
MTDVAPPHPRKTDILILTGSDDRWDISDIKNRHITMTTAAHSHLHSRALQSDWIMSVSVTSKTPTPPRGLKGGQDLPYNCIPISITAIVFVG